MIDLPSALSLTGSIELKFCELYNAQLNAKKETEYKNCTILESYFPLQMALTRCLDPGAKHS